LKKVLLLTKDVKQWFETFKADEAFDRLRRIRRHSDKDVTISSDLLEVRIMDTWWRDNLRGYKCDVVILDMAMEMDDWEMFKYNAKEIRFGERANYLLGGKKIAPFHGSIGLLEAENEKLKESEMKFKVKDAHMDGDGPEIKGGGFVYWK
jgi:hypothetical protein